MPRLKDDPRPYQLRSHQTAHNKGKDCAFESCDRAAFCRGVCKLHYNRWKSVKRRLEENIERAGPDDCWGWKGKNLMKGGRPRVHFRGIEHRVERSKRKTMTAFRLIKLIELGPLGQPLDEEVAHLCHNPTCVNPAHGEWMTHKENMAMEAGEKWQRRNQG